MTDSERPSAIARTREELADFLLDIGATLSSYGCPSYRLEGVIRLVADLAGQRAEPFALPTGLFLRVSAKDGSSASVNRMTRVADWGVDLGKLDAVDAIFNDVAEQRATFEDARARIRDVVAARAEWSPTLVWAASTASSGAAAVFLGGGLVDVLAASLVGAVIGGGRALLSRQPAHRLLNDFFGGLFAAACAWVATRLWPSASTQIVVLAGAISLFPGMTLTTGVAEIAQKNLVAGGARLMEAAVTLLLLFFGVALLAGFQRLPFTVASPHVPLGLPYQAAAMVVASLAFGVIFQVPRRWLWTALGSGATGYVVTALGARHVMPGHVIAFCSALAVCMFANALARATQRPAQLFQLPGMMFLVPGSFGFSSLGDFLDDQLVAGARKGFTMAMVTAGLVIGLLVANVVLPARKLL